MAKSSSISYRLDGPEGFTLTAKQPSDEIALSWAIAVLSYREGDPRPGSIAPNGDFKLTMIGGTIEEPIWDLRRTPNKNFRLGPTISWDVASVKPKYPVLSLGSGS